MIPGVRIAIFAEIRPKKHYSPLCLFFDHENELNWQLDYVACLLIISLNAMTGISVQCCTPKISELLWVCVQCDGTIFLSWHTIVCFFQGVWYCNGFAESWHRLHCSKILGLMTCTPIECESVSPPLTPKNLHWIGLHTCFYPLCLVLHN